jgi:hypothetical protein
MSFHPPAVTQRQPKEQCGVVDFDDTRYAVSAQIHVRAETRRLFHAIVVPEYLEAWLRVPDAGASLIVSPLKQSTGFAFNWCNAIDLQSRIVAVYKICRRRRLTLCWKIENGGYQSESTVVMRLAGNFGSSTLSVFHSGFACFADFTWHRQFWNDSLRSLANLF